VALSAVDLSFRKIGLRRLRRVPVLSASRIGQEKGDGTCADFLMLAISGVNTGPAPMALV